MRILFLLFVLFALISCSDSSYQSKPDPLIKSQIEYILVHSNSIFGAEKHFNDTIYYPVQESWIKEEFIPKFEKFSFDLKRGNVLADCDDYAYLAKSYANFIGKIKSPESDSGLAFGVIHYKKDDVKKGHAINIIMIQNEKGPKMMFLEPQTAKIVSLSREELETAMFIEF